MTLCKHVNVLQQLQFILFFSNLDQIFKKSLSWSTKWQ